MSMTQAEKLSKLIQKAIDGGWEPEEWVQGPQHLTQSLMQMDKVNTVIFNHGFAKALWGDNVYYTTYRDMFGSTVSKDDPKAIKGHANGLPKWQYRLQQMVIADDPIDYMYKAVFND